jgi:hypothetical protein
MICQIEAGIASKLKYRPPDRCDLPADPVPQTRKSLPDQGVPTLSHPEDIGVSGLTGGLGHINSLTIQEASIGNRTLRARMTYCEKVLRGNDRGGREVANLKALRRVD